MKCSCGVELNNETTIVSTEFDKPGDEDESFIDVQVECIQCGKMYFAVVETNSLIAEE